MLEVYWTRFIHVNSTFRCAFRLPVMRHRTSILNTPQISRSKSARISLVGNIGRMRTENHFGTSILG